MAGPKHSNTGKAVWDGVDVSDTRSWSLDDGIDNVPFVTSDTGGQTQREAGNKDWTSSVLSYNPDAKEYPFSKGDKASAELFTATLPGIGGKWTGAAIIGPLAAVVDLEGNALVGTTIAIEADGAIVFTANP